MPFCADSIPTWRLLKVETMIEHWYSCCGQVVDVPLIPEPASSVDHEHANGDKSSGATNGHAVAAQASHSHGSTGAMDGTRELEVGSMPTLFLYIFIALQEDTT